MEIYFQKAKYPLNIVRMWVKGPFCGLRGIYGITDLRNYGFEYNCLKSVNL